jgi:hypothetical protein
MKIMTMCLVALLFATPITSIHAQEVTAQDVRAVAPQMIQLLSTLSIKLSGIQAQQQRENQVLMQMHATLGGFSSVLAQQNPTTAQVDAMAQVVQGMRNQVTVIAQERTGTSQRLDSIVTSIAGVVRILTSIPR